jgi:hypothetical protein
VAVKPVISIDVDSSKFEKFFELFNQYNAALGEQPDAWNALNDAMAGAGEALEKGAVSGGEALGKAASEAQRIVIHLREATTAQQTFSRATASHAKGFTDLGKAGRGAWQAIGGAADASITKTTSGLAGMLSMLGPIGIGVSTVIGAAVAGVGAAKALADAAVARQRSAFGVGTTPGRQSAFGVYGQQFFGDGQSALQSAANVQSNFGNAAALGALGIDFNQARNMSKSDLAFAMLKSGVRIANASPDLPLGNNPLLAQYAALTGDKDFDQLRNAIAMGPGALDAAQAATNRNVGRMDLNRGAVANAALLKKSVEGAGVTAQSWLINNTSGLDPKIAKGIDALSGDPRAQLSVASAAQHVANVIDQKTVPAMEHFNHALNESTGGLLHQAKAALNNFSGWFNEKTGGFGTTGGMMIGPGGTLVPVPGRGSSASAAIIAAAKRAGVDPLLALAAATQESGLNPKAKGDYVHGRPTSFGLFQLHEGGELGNLTPQQAFDATTNASIALAEFAKVQKAHPDWSPGQIAAGAQRPLNPNSYAIDVNALYNQMRNSRQPTILVQVTNATPSRVAVSVKAAAP